MTDLERQSAALSAEAVRKVYGDGTQALCGLSLVVITPLALLGGVFYAANRLQQPWRTLTRADPLYYLVDATREGWAGAHEATVTLGLLVALAAAAAVFASAVALVSRGWRLKP